MSWLGVKEDVVKGGCIRELGYNLLGACFPFGGSIGSGGSDISNLFLLCLHLLFLLQILGQNSGQSAVNHALQFFSFLLFLSFLLLLLNRAWVLHNKSRCLFNNLTMTGGVKSISIDREKTDNCEMFWPCRSQEDRKVRFICLGMHADILLLHA